MKGAEIKKILKDEGIGLCTLAKKMGYTREQNLYSVLSVDDVRSGVLEHIAKTIGKPVSWFYRDAEGMKAVSIPSTPVQDVISVEGDNNTIATISERFIGLLEEKDKQINALLNIITNK